MWQKSQIATDSAANILLLRKKDNDKWTIPGGTLISVPSTVELPLAGKLHLTPGREARRCIAPIRKKCPKDRSALATCLRRCQCFRASQAGLNDDNLNSRKGFESLLKSPLLDQSFRHPHYGQC
jgi:hypothetical protein